METQEQQESTETKLERRDGCGEKNQKNHTITMKNTGRIKIRETSKITRRDIKKMHRSEQKN